MQRQIGFCSFLKAAGVALAMAAMVPGTASAQFSDGYNFLKAVKDRDGTKATELVDKPGSTIVNTRDTTSGETALHMVVARRDTTWLSYLLAKGADPDLTDNGGNTPLMSAVQIRFLDGARYLLAQRASVDKPNDRGETPLIRAVQLRDLPMVRLLIAEGANPDKPDNIAGMSARDYAKRDARTPGLLEALDAAKVKTIDKSKVQGPGI